MFELFDSVEFLFDYAYRSNFKWVTLIGDDECHSHVSNDEQSLTGRLTIDGTHRGSEFYIPCSNVKITAWFVICGA